jgi:hypothetical protein
MLGAFDPVKESWKSEFRLIRDIWTGTYPADVDASTSYDLSYVERGVMVTLVFLRAFSLSHIGSVHRTDRARSHFSENYVVTWLASLGAMLWLWPTSDIPAFLAAYRIVDSFVYRLCIIFVDRYKPSWGLRSVNRAIILALINYLELTIGFAIIYAWSGAISSHTHTLTGALEALYFSCITVTTLGYGDFSPSNSFGQLLVIIETMMGIVLLVLVIGALVSGLSNIRPIRRDR